MKAAFHREITTSALQSRVSPHALEAILRANLSQDGWVGLLFHPEFHFDGSRFDAGEAYLSAQHDLARSFLIKGDPLPAWQAFGRLSHASQDFYAHSNYVQLFLKAYPHSLPAQIDPLLPVILNDSRLYSGRVHWGWELLLYLFPGLSTRLQARIPPDSHAGMNLDHPGRGVWFEFAMQAAIQRTAHEFQVLLAPLDISAHQLFCDRPD